MAEPIGLRGPVELRDGALILEIPLDSGGAALADAARGIGAIEGEFLVVHIPDWLAQKLGIDEGTVVDISNVSGKFNIIPVPAHDKDRGAAS